MRLAIQNGPKELGGYKYFTVQVLQGAICDQGLLGSAFLKGL